MRLLWGLNVVGAFLMDVVVGVVTLVWRQTDFCYLRGGGKSSEHSRPMMDFRTRACDITMAFIFTISYLQNRTFNGSDFRAYYLGETRAVVIYPMGIRFYLFSKQMLRFVGWVIHQLS